MFSPRAHAVLDYITVGTFLIGAGLFWQRNRRAALAALICGGSELGVSLLTDYPGGITKRITFEKHSKIDLGLAAMTATMPQFLAFKDDTERKFFLAQGMVITAVTELTEFPNKARRAENRSKAA